MNKRAYRGAYFLACLSKSEEIYNCIETDGDKSFENLIKTTILITKVNENRFYNAYHQYVAFLSGEKKWYQLKSSIRNIVAEYHGLVSYEMKEIIVDYFLLIKKEYMEIELRTKEENCRDERYLLDGPLYAQIYDVDYNQHDEVKFKMSLLSDNMMSYDSVMFDDEEISNYSLKYYRPYFVEFESDYLKREYFEDILNDLKESCEKWITVQFVKENDLGEGRIMKGNYLFSASPIKIGRRSIEISSTTIPEKVLKHKNKYLTDVRCRAYDVSSTTLKKELDKLFPNKAKNVEVTLYNVGQGNLSVIKCDKKEFIFDLGDSGLSKDPVEKKLHMISREFTKKLKPDGVILSHWDLDHILGITNMKDDIFDCHWIVPDIDKNSGFAISALRLYCFLDWYKKTTLIAISSNKKSGYNGQIFYSNNLIELGKGTGGVYQKKNSNYLCGDINSLNYNNNFGLMLKVQGQNAEIIFPGDCEYEAFPHAFMTEFPEYLVVPHHGSKMLFNKVLPHKRAKRAFILSGSNSYKCMLEKTNECRSHPHPCHLNFLNDRGYDIHRITLTSYYSFSV